MVNKRKHNGFSHNPFMMGYDSHIYDGDEDFGFVFPKRRLITSSGFTSLEKIMKEIELGDKVVVNIGDSSTSGWNSNKVYRGNKDPNAPFFSYKTYSQLMEEQSDLMMVNAGVPGYSSLQGRKYLEQFQAPICHILKPQTPILQYFPSSPHLQHYHRQSSFCSHCDPKHALSFLKLGIEYSDFAVLSLF